MMILNLKFGSQKMENLKKHFPDAEFDIVDLAEKRILSCAGCLNCWVKTPGQCILKDDMADLYPRYLNADLVIFSAPLKKTGFLPAKMRAFTERLIPLLHPFIHLEKGECHHQRRYDRYPKLGLMIQNPLGFSADEIALVKEIMTRSFLNLKSEMAYFEAEEIA